MIARAFIFAIAAALPAAANARALSTDFCADQYLLALANPADIAALSPDADKDFSYMRAKAEGIRRIRPSAETALALSPDVVLRFWGGDEARLKALGLNVVTLNYASDFEGVKANIEAAAAALGAEARGRKIVGDIEARLETLAARSGSHPATLYVTPGGVTAGKGTMIDAILSAAGVRNISADNGLAYWGALPAEAVVADPPALIVTGFFSANSERINHWSAARHPAFRKIFGETLTIHLSTDVLSCPGWFSLDAAETIADALEEQK